MTSLNTQMKELLHNHYLNLREMLDAGVPARGVQKSFEELVYSIVGKNSWRPTHISTDAIMEYVDGTPRNIQRAHGAVGERLDRYVRTMNLLKGSVLEFEDWWSYFIEHDKTVLITRKEHGSGKKFIEAELVPLPDWSLGMFENSGFSVRLRKRTEGKWIHEKYRILTNSSEDYTYT